ncbi:hypothetical protein THIOM_000618 [Candidatus Thiomargarita nelsonii]|uniref:Uncharacterized protein n=1 Tax=Candidatus Thiomargarita nelsonii TaxID=1003181 RepID=A0A176S6S1_9GAMM|nr:hypothetical protein THIOM_000618 [Candidatus Thiomargarita nelsonii]
MKFLTTTNLAIFHDLVADTIGWRLLGLAPALGFAIFDGAVLIFLKLERSQRLFWLC